MESPGWFKCSTETAASPMRNVPCSRSTKRRSAPISSISTGKKSCAICPASTSRMPRPEPWLPYTVMRLPGT